MTRQIILSVIAFCTFSGLYAQDKKEIKAIEKEFGMYTSHSQFYKNKEWALCKFSIVFKLTTAMTTTALVNNKAIAVKVKSTSGAYAILNGLTEADLQAITNRVAENFIKRMKEESGVNIATWSSFKNSKNTEELMEAREDREIYSKSQGLAYAMTYDSTPHYYRMIVYVPGGKKLAKELNKNVMEVCMYIDFADVVATATADIRTGYGYYVWSKGADQKMDPGVRLRFNLGSQAAVAELGTNMSTTCIKGHDNYGYMFSMGFTKDIVSSLPFVDKIEPSKGKIPEVLSNRRNNKIEDVTTFNVFTNPPKFSDAVMDVTNQYFNNFIKVYNFRAKE